MLSLLYAKYGLFISNSGGTVVSATGQNVDSVEEPVMVVTVSTTRGVNTYYRVSSLLFTPLEIVMAKNRCFRGFFSLFFLLFFLNQIDLVPTQDTVECPYQNYYVWWIYMKNIVYQ